MTRDEQLIKTALEMAANWIEEYDFHTEDGVADIPSTDAGRFIRAISPADVLAKVGDERCAKCGHPRSNHPYRHPFVGMGNDPSATQPARLLHRGSRIG